MKSISLVLLVLAMPISTHAQEDVSISVTTAQDHPVISISNGHNLPIEAFLVTVDIPATNKPLSRIYYDVHLNYKHDVAIPAGTSKQVPLPHIVGEELPVPTLRAVVFSDGSTQGDGTWVHELLHMRTILADRIQQIIALLQNASNQKLTREETLDIVKKARQASRDETPNATADERVRHEQSFYMAIRNLERYQGRGNAPDPSQSIEHLSRTLSVWLSDLQAANPPLRPRAGGSD